MIGAVASVDGAAASNGFAGRRVQLQRGWRQSQALDLAPLAAACRQGDAAAALALLRGGALAGVHWHQDQGDTLAIGRKALPAHAHRLRDAADPAQALALANELRVLTAVREGPQGAATLNARIEALLRRSNLQAPVAVLATQDSSAPPVLRLDPVGRSAWLQNQELELAPREWTLLRLLTEHFGNAISRAQIIAAWEQDADAAANLMQTNTPEVYIHRLRKKLEHSPVTIRTVRGLGYMLRNR